MEEVSKTVYVVKASDFKVVASQLIHKLRQAEAQVPPEDNKFFTSALCAAVSQPSGEVCGDLMLYMEGTIIANHWPAVRHCKPRLLVTDNYKFFKAFVRSSSAQEVPSDLVTTVLKVDRGIRVKLAGKIIHGM